MLTTAGATAPAKPVDKSEARVRRMFAEIAERYDALNHLLSLGVDKFWRWRTVKRVQAVAGGGPILDLCTGTGDLALAYLRHSSPREQIVAADFCHEMLAIGRRKAHAAAEGSRLTFLEADAQCLPLPSDHFQIVCVAFGLRNVTDTDRGLAEMVRVCRPGGRVAVLEFSQPMWQPFRAIYGWYFRNVLPKIGQALARNRQGAYRYLPESVGQFDAGEKLVQRMKSSGLVDVSHRPLTFGVATLYVGHKPATGEST